MKSLLRPVVLLASSAFLLLAARPAPEGFLEAFKAALKAGDTDQMQALVKGSQDEAVTTVMATCESISQGPTEELEVLIDALGKAWRGAFDTKFVNKQYEYFSLMRPEIRTSRAELMAKYVGERTKYDSAMAEKSYRELPGIGYELENYAKGFLEIGDLFHSSEAWLMHAWSFEEEFLGDDANLETSFAGFEQALRMREDMALLDSKYESAKERFETLKNAGVGDPENEFTGSLAGKARREAAEAAAVTVGLEFELVKDISQKRPYYCADIVYQAWPGIALQGEGTKQPFPYVEDSPMLMRTGAASAAVDLDGDGEGDVSVPLTGSIVPVEITLGQGDEARPWGFLAKIGQSRDRYQGFDFNLESTPEALTIYTGPAASIVGELMGTPIRVLDDNMDGLYGSGVLNWAHIGTAEDSSGQADMDSMFVGKEKSARPWSPLAQIGEDWFQLEIEGTKLTAMPAAEVETGTLKLDFKGLKPDYVIVQGATKWGDCYFDLVPAKKGLEVPVGTYYLISGRVSKGKREQVMKALIVPPVKAKGFELKAGEGLTIELGAPFGFDFDISQGNSSVTVNGASVTISGRGGETYQRLWNCVVTPEASMRKAGTKKAYVSESMKTASHQDDLIQHGYEGAWFPWDLELPKKKEGDEAEVQLFMKKHKLFGKIESEWRN